MQDVVDNGECFWKMYCLTLVCFYSLRFDWLCLQVPDSKYQEGVYPTNQYRDFNVLLTISKARMYQWLWY